ncbi:transcriptional regulator [Paenibacillaceae bacterium]|nr:transcriptional regulator [Paenibacillaceae bacterium]
MTITLREEVKGRLRNNDFNCEKEITLSIISGKWKAVILWHLGFEGPHRFGELQRLFTNLSNRILTKQLRELEHDGIICRKIYSEVPPRVEYRMTALGITILPIVDALFQWGKQNMPYYIDRMNEEH